MNLPASRFHLTMHYLALIAMVLMLCMPLLSRWQQSHAPAAQAAHKEMCLSDASRAARAGHDAHQHLEDDAPATPHAQHDHDACGYCVLATRMLPVLALVLALPLPQRARHSPERARPAPPTAFFWSAHNPRGPPLIS